MSIDLFSAVAQTTNTIRLVFTAEPLAALQTGTHDALNPANYTIFSPTPVVLTKITAVEDVPHAIDLMFATSLPLGQWTITVVNIETALGDTLGSTTALTFSITALPVPLSQGGKNISAQSILRRHLDPVFKGKNWNALLTGLARGDRYLSDLARSAANQLWSPTAEGVYLDRLANTVRVQRPRNAGLSDQQLRDLTIRITAEQVTLSSLLGTLEVFYGSDALRASLVSTATEPFALQDLDTLSVLVNGRTTVPVTFRTAQFDTIGTATAAEVAQVLTYEFRNAESLAYALPTIDSETELVHVTIYSSALGLGSSLELLGGSAQSVLQFPTIVTLGEIGAAWSIAPISPLPSGRVRLSIAVATGFDIALVHEGDYINLYDSVFNVANRGSFKIISTAKEWAGAFWSQYLDYINSDAVLQLGAIQTTTNGVLVFRSKSTIQKDSQRTLSITGQSPRTLSIRLPATPTVTRDPAIAAYGRLNTAIEDASAIERERSGVLSITTATPQSLVLGQQVIVDGLRPGANPPVVPVVPSNPGLTSHSTRSLLTPIVDTAAGHQGSVALAMGNDLYLVGGQDHLGAATNAVTKLHTFSSTIPPDHEQVGYEWSAAPVYPTGTIEDHAGAVLSAASAFVCGGIHLGVVTTDAYTFDGAVFTAQALAHARRNHAVTALSNVGGDWEPDASAPWTHYGVWITGGQDAAVVSMRSIERYNALTDTMSDIGDQLTYARYDHLAIPLKQGHLLIVGGTTVDTGNARSCERIHLLIDGTYNGTRLVGRTSVARSVLSAAVVLPTGLVFVTGGPGPTAECEMFDPATNLWTRMPPMHYARSGHKMVVLESIIKPGSYFVLVMGWSGAVHTAEIFDLNTQTWKIAAIDDGPGSGGEIIATDGKHAVYAFGSADLVGATAFVQGAGVRSGRLNGFGRISTVTDPTHFKVSLHASPGEATQGDVTDAVITPIRATTETGLVGPFTFDTSAPAVTATTTTTAQILEQSVQYRTVSVADASAFPDEEGYIGFLLGTTDAFVVKYLGRLTNTSLVLDFKLAFPVDVPSGSVVTLLKQKGGWVPDDPTASHCFYLTTTAATRLGAQDTVRDIAAAGVTLDLQVKYPGDRGLAGEGRPTEGQAQLNDVVSIWAGDDVAGEVAAAREAE